MQVRRHDPKSGECSRRLTQVGGPDHGRRGHQESASDTSHGEPDELGGHDHEPLVWSGSNLVSLNCGPKGNRILTREVPRLVVEHTLDGDDVGGVGAGVTNGCHDGDQDVLLDVEWPGVQAVTEDLDVGEDTSHEPANGKRDQLGHEITDGDTGVAEEAGKERKCLNMTTP